MAPSYRIFRSWAWELVSVILAVGLISAITAILASYDGKPAPDWGERLNLNALLAFLSTILRGLLVIVISQIICQQKWDWYARPRRLSDLQKFDAGSRGSFGALLLIPTVIIKDAVALIAAAVLVVSFLVGPFVQQASRTMPCTFPAVVQNASLPYARYVPRQGGYAKDFRSSRGTPVPDITVAILSSITSPGGVENQISGSCSTGTCTFRETEQEDSAPRFIVDNDNTTHSTVGMCNTCMDITSLARTMNRSTTNPATMYRLPNGFNVSSGTGPSNARFAIMRPAPDLLWLGDMFTPELRVASRWAYVNATFLAVNTSSSAPTAAVCVLYPCLRTYTASINNDQLSEREISTEALEIGEHRGSPNSPEVMSDLNALNNVGRDYATIKSPCQVGGRLFEADGDASGFPNTTDITLYNFTEPNKLTSRKLKAPESCLYRHDAEFAMAISKVLHEEVLDGSCNWFGNFDCSKLRGASGYLADLGVTTVLKNLTNGEIAYSNVSSWFDSFANVMTNRFRFEYGAAIPKINATLDRGNDTPLPVGQVKGIAWQLETCVSAHKDWLALPIVLTAVTTLLMLWTIANNWRSRRTRPVWKDNLLPLLFYRHKIDSEGPATLPWQHDGNEADATDTDLHTARLLEANEMEKVGNRTLVTFRFPGRAALEGKGESAGTEAIALKEPARSSIREASQSTGRDAESLLEVADLQSSSEGNLRHPR
ncbi:hypothetical protein DE146DRAFT_752231 [Phaeosphaeria sp. MPI-PUGE-AT-0046c]|nr:hypothetical protein DE146DRAFT_752231 [Phaeosphaeria sp. MPI-PUGE-AT-0046c]